MAVDFVTPNDTIRQGLSIPSLNDVAGASLSIWFRARTVPPGPPPDNDKYALITSSIGPPPGTTNSSRIEIELQRDDPGPATRINCVSHILDGDPATTVSSAFGDVGTNTTTHVVATVDYTTREAKIYKNGVLIATGIITNSTAGNSSATNGKVGSIGSEDSGQPDAGNGERFDGQLEDGRVYSRVLSAAEVQTMYECQGIDGIVLGLEQRYELQSGFGGQLASAVAQQDSARRRIDGSVLFGSPTYTPSIAPTYRRRLP